MAGTWGGGWKLGVALLFLAAAPPGRAAEWPPMAGWGWSDPGLHKAPVVAGAAPLALQASHDSSIPPMLAAGQAYRLGFAFPSYGGMVSLRVKQARRWRIALAPAVPVSLTPVNVNGEVRDNPKPVLRKVPAAPPYAVAWEAALRPGWYFLSFDGEDFPDGVRLPKAIRLMASVANP